MSVYLTSAKRMKCPFNPNHQFAESNYRSHVQKCHQQHGQGWIQCKYNWAHFVRPEEMEAHLRSGACPDFLFAVQQVKMKVYNEVNQKTETTTARDGTLSAGTAASAPASQSPRGAPFRPERPTVTTPPPGISRRPPLPEAASNQAATSWMPKTPPPQRVVRHTGFSPTSSRSASPPPTLPPPLKPIILHNGAGTSVSPKQESHQMPPTLPIQSPRKEPPKQQNSPNRNQQQQNPPPINWTALENPQTFEPLTCVQIQSLTNGEKVRYHQLLIKWQLASLNAATRTTSTALVKITE